MMKQRETSEPGSRNTNRYDKPTVLKSWLSAEPNLPPEVVDWEHLIQRVTSDEKFVAEDVLVDVVAARYRVPKAIACDTVDEAVRLGLIKMVDEGLKLAAAPRKEVTHNG